MEIKIENSQNIMAIMKLMMLIKQAWLVFTVKLNYINWNGKIGETMNTVRVQETNVRTSLSWQSDWRRKTCHNFVFLKYQLHDIKMFVIILINKVSFTLMI